MPASPAAAAAARAATLTGWATASRMHHSSGCDGGGGGYVAAAAPPTDASERPRRTSGASTPPPHPPASVSPPRRRRRRGGASPDVVIGVHAPAGGEWAPPRLSLAAPRAPAGGGRDDTLPSRLSLPLTARRGRWAATATTAANARGPFARTPSEGARGGAGGAPARRTGVPAADRLPRPATAPAAGAAWVDADGAADAPGGRSSLPRTFAFRVADGDDALVTAGAAAEAAAGLPAAAPRRDAAAAVESAVPLRRPPSLLGRLALRVRPWRGRGACGGHAGVCT